jgi:hypothetical protein
MVAMRLPISFAIFVTIALASAVPASAGSVCNVGRFVQLGRVNYLLPGGLSRAIRAKIDPGTVRH